MTIRGKWASLALAAGGALMAGTAVVQAADRDFCDEYAKTAVTQVRIDIERHCGFGGGRWSPEWRAHFDWCRGTSVHEAEQERDIRTGAIRRCTGR
jgi:hypothetical protein